VAWERWWCAEALPLQSSAKAGRPLAATTVMRAVRCQQPAAPRQSSGGNGPHGQHQVLRLLGAHWNAAGGWEYGRQRGSSLAAAVVRVQPGRRITSCHVMRHASGFEGEKEP
jgi:hypothetical protein